MSKLLLDEHPLVILPELAVEIGLNEAIFLQQIHYWLIKSKNDFDGQKWTYNSYESLQEQFPFFSISTIKRIVKNLVEKELLIINNFNTDKRDKTNWYSINYANFDALFTGSNEDCASCQSDTMGSVNMTPCIIGTETTTEKKSKKKIFTSDDLSVAQYLFAHIKAIYSSAKEPNWDDWANEIRLLREVDGKSLKAIRNLIDMIFKDNGVYDGSFWRQNIRSTAKLRKQYDQIAYQVSLAFKNQKD